METQQAIREMTISEKVIEGRRRMLTCLDNIGAQDESVDLLELQKDYLRTFGSYLNKDELRSYFSKTHIKHIFHFYMHKDVDMSTDINQTGSLFLKLKRPLQAALADPPFNRGNRNRIEHPDSKITQRNPNLIPLPPNKVKSFIAAAPAPVAMHAPIAMHVPAPAVDHKNPPKPVAAPRARGKVDNTGKQYGFDLLSSDEEQQQPQQPANGGGKPAKDKENAIEKEKYSWDESDCEEEDAEAEEEEQEVEEEDTDDDKLLEANNDHISKENLLAKGEQQPKAAVAGKPVVAIRNASHSDKYKREVMKMREQEKLQQQQLAVAAVNGWDDDEEEIVVGTNNGNGTANDTSNANAMLELDPEVETLKQRCLRNLELKKQAMLLGGGKNSTVQAITRALVEPHAVKKTPPPPKATKAGAAKLQLANLMSSDEGDAESVNDEEEEEEEEVIMSKAPPAKAKPANKKSLLAVAAFEKGSTDSVEAEEDNSIGLGTPSPQQNAKDGPVNFDQLPEAMRFELCGMVAISVKLEGAVKPEIVHAKLGSNQEYSHLYSGVIKTVQDLVAFVQRFCLNAVHVQNLPSGPLLVYQEEPGKHYSIGYLLQKVGKTMMQKGGD